jgi:hypothetical protein
VAFPSLHFGEVTPSRFITTKTAQLMLSLASVMQSMEYERSKPLRLCGSFHLNSDSLWNLVDFHLSVNIKDLELTVDIVDVLLAIK